MVQIREAEMKVIQPVLDAARKWRALFDRQFTAPRQALRGEGLELYDAVGRFEALQEAIARGVDGKELERLAAELNE